MTDKNRLLHAAEDFGVGHAVSIMEFREGKVFRET